MNYIWQLNRFYDSLQTNSLTPNSICLYSTLLHINNKCNWKAEFTVANKSIEALAGLSRVQLDRSRNELKQKGYIDYKKGTGNVAGTYSIVIFDTQADTQVYAHGDTQPYTQTDTQVIHKCSTLNKLNLNKTKHLEVSKNGDNAGGRASASYEQILDDMSVSDSVRPMIWSFVKHCQLNSKMLTNDKLADILIRLDFANFNDDDKIQCFKRAIDGGYFDVRV